MPLQFDPNIWHNVSEWRLVILMILCKQGQHDIKVTSTLEYFFPNCLKCMYIFSELAVIITNLYPISSGSNFNCLSYLSPQVSDESDSPEPGPVPCMEPFLVRRLSCRTVQLPPLAFRQAEQYYFDRKPEPDTVTVPPRPTSLPLRALPLIAITSADTTR